MNAYYDYNSISTVNEQKTATAGDGLISFICAMVAFFTNAVTVAVAKISTSTLALILFFGVIGGMDRGSIGMLFGLILCLALSAVEFLILKSMYKKSRAEK